MSSILGIYFNISIYSFQCVRKWLKIFNCLIYLARAILTCDKAPKETGKVSTMATFNENTTPGKKNEFDDKFVVYVGRPQSCASTTVRVNTYTSER